MRAAMILLFSVLPLGCWLYEWDSRNFLTTGPESELISLEVTDAKGVVLWKIEVDGDVRRVDRVEFGIVPTGYRQVVPPPPTAPRTLRIDESLMIRIETIPSVLEQQANAVGPAEMVAGSYELTMRQRP